MATGLRYFGREVRVQVGPYGGNGLEYADLRAEFDIERVDVEALSKGKVVLYNLAPESIGFIQKFGQLPQQRDGSRFLIPGQVRVFAGYKDQGGAQLIFSGHIEPFQGVALRRTGTDVIVEINAVDGGGFAAQAQTTTHIKGPVTAREVLGLLAADLGVSVGHLPVDAPVTNYPRGFAFQGPTRDALRQVCTAAGLRWSIQDDLLIFTEQGKPTLEQAPLISPDTGLIGSPERIDGGRRVRFTALLTPALRPRRRVRLESVDVKGNYILQKVKHTGDNGYSDKFHSVCEGLSEEWGLMYRTDDGWRQ